MYPVKLRAWDKTNKVMWQPAIKFGDGRPIRVTQKENVSPTEPYVWMLFTGKLDANGKEIYDGDIMEYFTIKKIVGWSNETAQWCLKRSLDENAKYTEQLATVDLNKSKVIGNIYENSELI